MWDIKCKPPLPCLMLLQNYRFIRVVGVGYTKWNVQFILLDGKKKSASEDKFAVNLGCGVQHQLTD